ncbi:MAG TPA: preprotein translocase subunit SecG, partial [Tepidisphaeraceae bacterium]|nr:preprotein translocase subunit SecG [Tepidisphaeraceae bacterium]
MAFLFWTIFVLFILVCLFLILLVLIQKGRGGGLAGAFGGMGGNTAFGSKTGDVLTWTTAGAFGVFLVLAISLNLLANARNNPAQPVPPPVQTSDPLSNNVPAAVPDTAASPADAAPSPTAPDAGAG